MTKKVGSLRVALGTPVEVQYGTSHKDQKVYKAPSTGFIVLSNSGPSYATATAEVNGSGKRLAYVNGVLDVNASQMLPAEKDDEFSVWASQDTVKIYFIPLGFEVTEDAN
ncbi:MAG: hypothetical protein R3C20_12660 [Planctomycetaceae bacterium]